MCTASASNKRKLFKTPIKIILVFYANLLFALPSSAGVTADTAGLKTWVHGNNYEINATGPVADNKVRSSSFYEVRVSRVADPENYFDSFTYMSIPRSGRAKWLYSDADGDYGVDGAEFADQADLSMSWSSFLFGEDVWVEVSLRNGETFSSVSDVTIRPTVLNFVKEKMDADTIRIKVPYSSNGRRFSVEFNHQLYTAYNDKTQGDSGKLTTVAAGNYEVHTEPKNALLIFAEPIALPDYLLPDLSAAQTDGVVYEHPPGEIVNLNEVAADIIYFPPGIYYMRWDYHAKLPARVKWLHLAPGAYIKGAFQFTDSVQEEYKVTGYGVISGEKYVYEADTKNDYKRRLQHNSNCHGDCVKMLQFEASGEQQYLYMRGITLNEPPYHSFVVYPKPGNSEETDLEAFSMRVKNYKQVGSWYWQTDGMELYSNSYMKNSFFHANDDVIKLYHSNLDIDNTVIWKGENGPVIQWGWKPRSFENVSVTDTYVIHNRMGWNDKKYNTCVFNASRHWASDSMELGDTTKTIKNISFDNFIVEGKTNCGIRIYAMANTENIHFNNVSIDGWNELDATGTVSEFFPMTNSADIPVAIGNELINSRGIKLENFKVAGEYISRAANNWNSLQLGKLNFDSALWDNWNAWVSADMSSSYSNIWLAGGFTNWSLVPMSFQQGNFNITLPLSTGSHQLKFANSSNWSAIDWGNTSGLQGQATQSTGGLANLSFMINHAGDYTIRFNPDTGNYYIYKL